MVLRVRHCRLPLTKEKREARLARLQDPTETGEKNGLRLVEGPPCPPVVAACRVGRKDKSEYWERIIRVMPISATESHLFFFNSAQDRIGGLGMGGQIVSRRSHQQFFARVACWRWTIRCLVVTSGASRLGRRRSRTRSPAVTKISVRPLPPPSAFYFPLYTATIEDCSQPSGPFLLHSEEGEEKGRRASNDRLDLALRLAPVMLPNSDLWLPTHPRPIIKLNC
jgi:hypothetical protein